MLCIELKNILLHAYHGIYAGEPKMGGDFEVNLQVFFNEEGHDFVRLNQTINYVLLFDMVKKRMEEPTHLLEKLCDNIIHDIKQKFPFILEANLSIYKLQAPIENFHGKVGVTLFKKFE